jgi:flavin reductase (DIM6/NTAB) family NADH-FMN oxidoreductase RutF
MDINPATLPHHEVYKLLIGSIVPRPIAWVSTRSADGIPNLAPFSFFTAVCSAPPTVIFCAGVREADHAQKDTLHNIRATGEYIINFVSEPLAEAMNITAVEAPAHVDEFQRAGLKAEPGMLVNVLRVAASLIHFECKLNQIVTISEQPGGGNIIIGTVVFMHFDDSVYRDGNRIDLNVLQPVGRLAGTQYSRVNDFFDLQRPPSEVEKR